jgi:hypothetical protein
MKFESVTGEQGYKWCISDHCVFIHRFSGDDFIILLLCVDDILIVGKNVSRIARLKKELNKFFAMKDLGPAKCILVRVLTLSTNLDSLRVQFDSLNKYFIYIYISGLWFIH